MTKRTLPSDPIPAVNLYLEEHPKHKLDLEYVKALPLIINLRSAFVNLLESSSLGRNLRHAINVHDHNELPEMLMVEIYCCCSDLPTEMIVFICTFTAQSQPTQFRDAPYRTKHELFPCDDYGVRIFKNVKFCAEQIGRLVVKNNITVEDSLLPSCRDDYLILLLAGILVLAVTNVTRCSGPFEAGIIIQLIKNRERTPDGLSRSKRMDIYGGPARIQFRHNQNELHTFTIKLHETIERFSVIGIPRALKRVEPRYVEQRTIQYQIRIANLVKVLTVLIVFPNINPIPPFSNEFPSETYNVRTPLDSENGAETYLQEILVHNFFPTYANTSGLPKWGSLPKDVIKAGQTYLDRAGVTSKSPFLNVKWVVESKVTFGDLADNF